VTAWGGGLVTNERAVQSPFFVLCHAFVTQLFTDESVTSDVKLRQTVIWVLAFLLAPGMFLLIQLFPELQDAVIRARFHRAPASSVDDLVAWIAFLFTTYSMAATGFITVLVWDRLTFDRRDGMVLGALPLRQGTILLAKLSALGAFLFGGSISINLLNATAFALETSDQAGIVVLLRHFIALLLATVAASVLIFAAIVFIRATVALLGGPRLASACGPPLQFLFVVGLLCLVIYCPFVLHISFASASFTNWMPSAWFVGLFEQLRGSPRGFDPRFPFLTLARRALVVTPTAILGALTVSVAEFRRHFRQTLAPPSFPGLLGGAHLSRRLARLIVGRDPIARATCDFILLTLARNRAQQAPIAINAALGAAIVIAALSNNTRTLASLMHPRTAVLWIPLVMGYWMTVGVRAAFFMPSELAASWSFQSSATEATSAYWSAVRGSTLAFVLPRTAVASGILVPLLGWRVAAWHFLVVGALTVVLVEVIALTIDFIPFTRPYQPGHAKLKTRWMVYAIGMFAFAYWPARIELSILGQPDRLIGMVSCAVAATAAIEVFGRHRSTTWSVQPADEFDEDLSTTVLNLGGIIQTAQH
jgi:hypothetical protein